MSRGVFFFGKKKKKTPLQIQATLDIKPCAEDRKREISEQVKEKVTVKKKNCLQKTVKR